MSQRQQNKSSGQAGITLIEIMVVLGIIGGLMGVLLGGGLLKSDDARLREAGVEVMATLRAAFNMATMSGKHHRVVFDLEKQVYHIEICIGAQTLKRGDEEEKVDLSEFERVKEKMAGAPTSDINAEVLKAESPEAALESAAALAGLRVGTSRCQPATNTITGQRSESGNKHKLDVERGIHIESIHVQHLNEPVEDSIVSINFFPVGSAEKAVVRLSNDDQEYSVVVHGMTSRVEFRNGEIDVDEHMRRNAMGDEEEER